MWKFNGQQRPDFAAAPGPGQESVWDFPRPPALVDCTQLIEVTSAGVLLARSERCKRVLETASPPTIYIPSVDINFAYLQRVRGMSMCEWKGAANYWGLKNSGNSQAVGWCYPTPTPAFIAIREWLSFYPGRVECFIDGERVRPQKGGFYGGWVTDSIAGPWKGAAGTSHW